jgi:hypothetical protein
VLGGNPEEVVNELPLACPSSLPNRRICPFRIMCIASYPSIVRHAPSTDRKPKLAVMRFLMKRWSCSMD